MSLPVLPLLILTLMWPLLLASLTAWPPTRQMTSRLLPWAALPALILAIFSATGETFYFPWLLLGTELKLDDTGHPFLILSALLWWLAGWYAHAYLPQQEHIRFFSFFNLAMLGNVGLILSQDMLSFYFFFTLMSFAAYGLVVHERTLTAIRAGKIYLILTVIGEVALYAAFTLAASASETLSFDMARQTIAHADSLNWIMALALLGFGIKAGVIILHVWLPLAHPVAPTPASAVLSGCMIKAGLLGWLRLLPLGEVMLYSWGGLFIVLGIAAAFFGVVVGLMQRDAKTLLAYSSISQMGVLTAAIGMGLMAPSAWSGTLSAILIYALHHGLAKGALFLGVGILGISNGRQQLRVWIALWLPALALAGAPFTSGMVAKSLLKMQSLHAPEIWSMVFQISLPCSAIATALLLGKFLLQLAPNTLKKSGSTASLAILAPWTLLLLTIASLPWWPLVNQDYFWSQSILLNSLWPIMLAGLILLLSIKRNRWLPRKLLAVSKHTHWQAIASLRFPPGDVLIPCERWIFNLLRSAGRFFSEYKLHWPQTLTFKIDKLVAKSQWQQFSDKLEYFLCKWPIALLFFLFIGLILALWKTDF